MMALFTTSMKKFNNQDIFSCTDHLLVIDQSMIVFNADLVDSTTVTRLEAKQLSMRLNLLDGTCVDKNFAISHDTITQQTV